jgi:hypothetical protein
MIETMNKNFTRKVRTMNLAILVLVSTSASGCFYSSLTGPYSAPAISTKVAESNDRLPVYIPRSASTRADVIPKFYYYYDGSTTRITTLFFSQAAGGQSTRIAKLHTSGFYPLPDGALRHAEKVRIVWADKAEASTCEITSETIMPDSPGEPYKVCIFWSVDKDWFLFYSVMDLDETLTLVDSLERFR